MIDGLDDRDDLEQHAGDLADQVFLRAAQRTVGHMLLVLLVFLIVEVGRRVTAILAIPVLPPSVAVGVGMLLTVDLGWHLVDIARRLRRNPPGRDRGLTREERTAHYAQRLRTAQAVLQREQTWACKIRRATWWRNQTINISYLGCLATLITDRTTSLTLGISAAIAGAGLILLKRDLLRRSLAPAVSLAQFGDLTAPKNTPEI